MREARIRIKRDNDILDWFDVSEEEAKKFHFRLVSNNQNNFIDLIVDEDEFYIFNKLSIKHVEITYFEEDEEGNDANEISTRVFG